MAAFAQTIGLTIQPQIAQSLKGVGDPRSDEEATEHLSQDQIRRDIRKRNEGQTEAETRNRERAPNRERVPHLAVADGNERQVDQRQQHGQRQSGGLGQQLRDSGDTAVDEVARQQKSLQAHAGQKDPQDDEH